MWSRSRIVCVVAIPKPVLIRRDKIPPTPPVWATPETIKINNHFLKTSFLRDDLKWDELLQSSNINIKGQCQSDPKSLISNESDFWPRWLQHPLLPTVLTILQGVSVQVDHSLGVFCPEAVGPPCRPWAGQHQSSWSSQAWGYNHPTALTDRQDQHCQITTLLHSSSFLLQNWCAKLLEMLNASLDRLYMSQVSLTGICIWIVCPLCTDCAAIA